MAREIELKAKISYPDELKSKISNFGTCLGEFEKHDEYWRLDKPDEISGGPGYGVRIRNESFINSNGESINKTYVTWKRKEVRGGVEFNNEKEFEVSSAEIFRDFLLSLGFRNRISKHKKGNAYSYENMTIEVTRVEKLGWFIELEILLSTENKKAETEARDKLLQTLDRLDIRRDAIEGRSYTQILQELYPT